MNNLLQRIIELIDRFLKGRRPSRKGRATRILFEVEESGKERRLIKGDAVYELPINLKVTFSIRPEDEKGNPGTIEGIPTWSTSDPTFGALTPSTDGKTAEFIPSGRLGTFQIKVIADAELGPGTSTITGVLDVTIKAGTAVRIVIVPGPTAPIGATPVP